MAFLQALALGVVQGLTEFLPISSSGHLVFFQTLFKMKEPMLAFDIALHAGTLTAVLVYFYKDFCSMAVDFWNCTVGALCPCACSPKADKPVKGLWFPVLLTLVPTGIMAVVFKQKIEEAFSQLSGVAVAWAILGPILLLSSKFQNGTKQLSSIGWVRALWVGLVQGFALMPGISRSGSTIVGGMLVGIKKEDAARFSFLISVPAVIAAIFMELRKGGAYFSSHESEVLIGFAAAAISGYLVIKWLFAIIQKGKFYVFGYYCLFMSVVAFLVSRYYS